MFRSSKRSQDSEQTKNKIRGSLCYNEVLLEKFEQCIMETNYMEEDQFNCLSSEKLSQLPQTREKVFKEEMSSEFTALGLMEIP